MICWQPVTQDCLGGPETMGTYMHESAYVRIIGEQPCGADPDAGLCPTYAYGSFTVWPATPDPCWPAVATPGPGEILFIRTTAIDAAGNPDCGT